MEGKIDDTLEKIASNFGVPVECMPLLIDDIIDSISNVDYFNNGKVFEYLLNK